MKQIFDVDIQVNVVAEYLSTSSVAFSFDFFDKKVSVVWDAAKSAARKNLKFLQHAFSCEFQPRKNL